jgi:hypothetical protein
MADILEMLCAFGTLIIGGFVVSLEVLPSCDCDMALVENLLGRTRRLHDVVFALPGAPTLRLSRTGEFVFARL